jgi:hypothetical protein
MSFFNDAAAIIFKQPFNQKIGKLAIDILDGRIISESTEITSNPVEGGYTNDNIKRIPTEISFTAKMSAFSLKNSIISQVSSLAKGRIPNRLKEAHDELYRLYNDQEPISLVSKYKTYDNMFMKDLSFPSEAGDGEVLRFNVVFQEINIVTSQLVSIDNAKIKNDNAKKQTNFGRQVGDNKTPAPAVNTGTITFGQFVKTLF